MRGVGLARGDLRDDGRVVLLVGDDVRLTAFAIPADFRLSRA